MKSIFFITTCAFLLVGGGCTKQAETARTSAPPQPAPVSNLCTVEPSQNEAGRLVYPIDAKYQRLPHLGQIFTALDCQDPDRAKRVPGFNPEEKYTAGILLKWRTEGASGQIREALRKLGFTEPDKQTMRSTYPYTIDDLRTLRDILNDPEAIQALDREDCITCG